MLKRTLLVLVLLAAGAALAWAVVQRLGELRRGEAEAVAERPPVPVEVGPVERGPVTLRRTFTGTLEASAEFVVSPRVGGQIEALEADIGDVVLRGALVARLDDDEFVQAANQAESDLAVARATRDEARSALEIAERELGRLEQLRSDGASSESQVDAARSRELAAQARVRVAESNVERAEASLEAARIRTAYTRVTADWNGDDDRRTVAERYVDEGGTIAANGALMSIVELDPVVGVLFVPERDYARIAPGQVATLTTDAYPGRSFEASVVRIAPVFRRATRQARVELQIPNPSEELKPGMFVRATLELERLPDVVVVPFDALTERGDETGVFALADDGERIAWVPVTVGVRDGARVQVEGEGLTARVVTLGQALCDDGGRVSVVEPGPAATSATEPDRDVPGGGSKAPGPAAQEAR